MSTLSIPHFGDDAPECSSQRLPVLRLHREKISRLGGRVPTPQFPTQPEFTSTVPFSAFKGQPPTVGRAPPTTLSGDFSGGRGKGRGRLQPIPCNLQPPLTPPPARQREHEHINKLEYHADFTGEKDGEGGAKQADGTREELRGGLMRRIGDREKEDHARERGV